MSSYFDRFDQQVNALSREHPEPVSFIVALIAHEATMIKTCEYFAGDVETPEDVRQCVMAVISLAAIQPCEGMTNERVKEMAIACRSSQLSRDMHGLFHDISRMRYQFRYGMVFDNPEEAVRSRDANAEQRRPKKPKAQTLPVLRLSDAPGYCRKVLEKLNQ